MCTGLEIAALVGTGASVKQGMDARKAGKAAEAQSRNAEAERKAAEAKATQDAYASTVFAKRAMRENSLFTGGGSMGGTGGQQTLGV